jgi:hypothetical protein
MVLLGGPIVVDMNGVTAAAEDNAALLLVIINDVPLTNNGVIDVKAMLCPFEFGCGRISDDDDDGGSDGDEWRRHRKRRQIDVALFIPTPTTNKRRSVGVGVNK